MSETSMIICSICNSNGKIIITDPESGEIICSKCGQVVADKIEDSNRPERRAFTTLEENHRSRIGMPTSLARHDRGLATIIGRSNKDASGQALGISMSSTIERLRMWDFRTQVHTSTDRNLKQAFDQLDVLKDKLGLSDAIVEKTAYVYRKAQGTGLVKGRTILGVLSAAVYIACREMGTPRTLSNIATICNIKRKELAKTYRLLVFKLDLKIPVVDPIKCIVRVANKANLNEKTKREAAKIMDRVVKKGISAGKDPMGLAAAILYLCSINEGQIISQMSIADAAGVTEVTIRNRYKDLKNKLN